MEDYIFILIAIILSVFGAMNQSKKKRELQAQDEDSEVLKNPSIFGQLFDDNFFTDDAPEEQAITPEEPEKSKIQPIGMREIRIPQNVRNSKRPPQPAQIKETKPVSTINSIKKDFSLKKAVIYSEILQRKY